MQIVEPIRSEPHGCRAVCTPLKSGENHAV